MNMIKEYLELLLKGLKNYKKITKSYFNLIRYKLNLLTEKEKETIRIRREICYSCPFNSVNAVEKGIYTTDRIDLHCMHCGCFIDLLTICFDCICSIDEYNKEKNTNIPVKWFPIK